MAELSSDKESVRKGAHWSTDYVEHLRSVHFTLIVVCVALIVLSTSRSQTEVKVARAQIEQVREFIQSFDPSWFDNYVPEAIKRAKGEDRSARYPQLRLPEGADSLQLNFHDEKGAKPTNFVLPVKLETQNWLLLVRNSPWTFNKGQGGTLQRLPEVLYRKPKNLREFTIFWNTASELELLLPATLGNTAYFEVYQGQFRKADLKMIKTGKPAEAELSLAAYSDLEAAGLKEENPDFASNAYVCYGAVIEDKPVPGQLHTDRKSIISIPVMSFDNGVAYDGQSALILHTGHGWDWRHGKFDSAFRQLSEITKNYEDLDMDTIRLILAGEEKRTGESFEAIGIKFPGENTTRWGILVIICIQIYFWIHLRELSPKLRSGDPGWDVAWIGIYSSRYARVAMFASTCLLPLGATLALGIRGLYVSSFAKTYWILLIPGAVASLGLSLLAWVRLPDVHVRRFENTIDNNASNR